MFGWVSKGANAMTSVSLYKAKTQLSSLVDRAAAGEEIIISKNGTPKAKLVPLPRPPMEPRRPSGLLKITYIADDFDDIDPEIIAMFEGED